MSRDYSDVLSKVESLEQSRPLTIIQLGEPFSATRLSGAGRNSDASADGFDNQTPEVLENDLTHYKELFSKLRFSYLEQVTKEKFLRAIVGDPPLIVEHQDNVELEAEIQETKAALKAKKAEVAQFVSELEAKGRDLVNRYENIHAQSSQLRSLPASIEHLQQSIASLRTSHETQTNPSLRLPLPATRSLIDDKRAELAALKQESAGLQSALPKKERELERLKVELRPLEAQRLGSSAAAKEAQKRKDDGLGGIGDDLEARARWWRAAEEGLRDMLEV